MKESDFIKVFEQVASECYRDLVIIKGANLFYELTLNQNLQLSVSDTTNPKRGNSAFQTDICIYEKINNIEFPRVVIEFKTKITTHDIITYSSKAGKHKKIYPGLRYGILADSISRIPNRFFIHNENIDFFLAFETYKNDKLLLKKFIKKLIDEEIQTAKTLEKLYHREEKFNYYRTTIILKDLDDE